MRKAFVILFLALLATGIIIHAQVKAVDPNLLNGRALLLPKPEYPESVRASGIGGIIGVNVVIDQSGNVISAEAELNDLTERRDASGTKLEPIPADSTLRASAEEAARKAKFAPTMRDGVAVQITGRIVYNFASSVGGNSQSEPIEQIDERVLGGMVISLAKPDYPSAAIASNAEGLVKVRIIVDEQGNVESLMAISGHELLRAAAVEAARGARFQPAIKNGKPIKVDSIVTYNFTKPKAT